jgi:hypothetical protein
MKNLSNITLLAIDNTHRIEGTIKAVYTSIQKINFGEVKILTSQVHKKKYEKELSEDNIKLELLNSNISNIDEYSKYVLYNLHSHVNTEFVLLIQDHAFIINPDAWTDEFLNYDYIGAPWQYSENSYITPFGEHIRVGNGGFSLRSQKILKTPLEVDIPFDCTKGNFYKHFNANNYAEDGNICVHNRHLFIENGCKFCPLELAVKFSYEKPIPENYGIIPFGFHYNLPLGVTLE